MTPNNSNRQTQAFAIRIWLSCLATQETMCLYLGIRLGLYDDLASNGPACASELAKRAGIGARYAREWLEQQAVAGVLVVDDPRETAEARVYALPAAHAEALIASDSPISKVAAILPVGAVGQIMPKLLAAYRNGEGLTDAEYGVDWREGHSGANRALFRHQFVSWLQQALPPLHQRLNSGGARVADIACGSGWASIAIAQAYPAARAWGFDIDPKIIEEARRNAAAAGVADRVGFQSLDGTRYSPSEKFDLVFMVDALHEIPRPVEILQTCRSLRADGGHVLVLDARVADSFTAPANEIERFQYTTSVLHCLPACLAGQDSAGTGTIMRIDTVRDYASRAGFSRVNVIEVDDRFHRLYDLVG